MSDGERKVEAEKSSAGFAELFSTIKPFLFNYFLQEISHYNWTNYWGQDQFESIVKHL